jgi:hypothetical protein
MLYEIPIAGVQVAAFLVLAIGSLAATAAICALTEISTRGMAFLSRALGLSGPRYCFVLTHRREIYVKRKDRTRPMNQGLRRRILLMPSQTKYQRSSRTVSS